MRLAALLARDAARQRLGTPEPLDSLGVGLAQEAGQALDRRRVEDGDHVHDLAEPLLQAVDQDRARDRVAAQFEEAVLDADRLDAERRAEHLRQLDLQSRARRHEFALHACGPVDAPPRQDRRGPPCRSGVSGIDSSVRIAEGTMYSGRLERRRSRSSTVCFRPAPRRPPAAGRRPPRARSRPPRAPPARAQSAASISPSSMRKPRIFTWWSMRPRYSIRPSASTRARSPVRYSRAPARRADRARTSPPSAPDGRDTRGPRPRRRCTARPAPRWVTGGSSGPECGSARSQSGRPIGTIPPARARQAQDVTSTAASVGP